MVIKSCEHGAAAQALIQSFVRSTLTLTFVIAAARVVFNIKVGICQVPQGWQPCGSFGYRVNCSHVNSKPA